MAGDENGTAATEPVWRIRGETVEITSHHTPNTTPLNFTINNVHCDANFDFAWPKEKKKEEKSEWIKDKKKPMWRGQK